ncbi:MAG: flagellar basal-body rod protein FlgF [Pseudomonadota bacterium]|jgi:flagellar basal-body rod protein FlgF|nr:flagellar basal-body rod protein FlgF [Xanthomonadaceae bacterium]MDE2247456.1 flagellar basal-body rod protein FlgF [Xanthomonadaceae bacterium]MDE3209296.1 flagellar basal-body rod protein FlgF [Pseudomonadota bacterium]
MDHSLYLAMTGATQLMRAQEAVSNNLANASTVGFKSELSAFKSLPVLGSGLSTRINAVAVGIGQDLSQGAIRTTGRPLDVALDGSGWLTVQAPDGSEAYTRAGDLQITADGQLTDAHGYPVMGASGPITIGDSQHIRIGEDGTISAVPAGNGPNTVSALGQLKLVNPPAGQLTLGSDGLMHMANGGQASVDPAVRVTSGALEGSNVNASAELVKMIALSRQYDMQIKSIKSAEDNAASATKLLQSN